MSILSTQMTFMRSLTYGVAVLAALGIMSLIIWYPDNAPTNAAGSANTVVPEVRTASLTMQVPEMHCPFACYPRVKENLEARENVVSVELAQQAKEGVIDNPQVIVTYHDEFDADGAIAKLEAEGFSGSTVLPQ